jgi:hypothetical protein
VKACGSGVTLGVRSRGVVHVRGQVAGIGGANTYCERSPQTTLCRSTTEPASGTTVQVNAESVFEAAALALHIFQTAGTPPGPAAHLEIAAQPPVVNHSISVQRVRDWLSSVGETSKEKVLKSRLRELS